MSPELTSVSGIEVMSPELAKLSLIFSDWIIEPKTASSLSIIILFIRFVIKAISDAPTILSLSKVLPALFREGYLLKREPLARSVFFISPQNMSRWVL